jgi:biotin transporter BioY
MAYPLVAFVAGWIYEKSSAHSSHKFACGAFASLMAEVVLFAGGLSWLAVQTHSIAMAIRFGLYWFVFAEVIKVMMAAAVASRWSKRSSQS